METEILECPHCGEKSVWVDYQGNQYKAVCPFCRRTMKGGRKIPEVPNGKETRKENSG